MNVDSRIDALRNTMIEARATAAIVSTATNMRYLTAFEGVIDRGINAACVVTETSARFFTDSRYIEAATAAAQGSLWQVHQQKENLYVEVCELLHSEGHSSLALESSVPYGRFSFISEQFRGAVRVMNRLVEEIRCVKEAEEIDRMTAAAAIADRGFDHILGVLATGKTEAEVALELEFFMRRNGSEEMPFAPIVASGPNASRPHAIPGERRIESGDLVVLDFGARFGGYCSDMTRTVAVGEVSDELTRMYDAVLEANEAGLAAVRAGMPCVEVDLAAREVLGRHGLGEYFTHGLGHGVGLDVHEMPTIGARSSHSLREGDVVTIEPGVYVDGVAGVRIEDLVAVNETGYELLTHSPKELIRV
ncbi:MAG: aminopeptidase P family protein [Coriobacteriia bacterium]|nr:aminopeptidase P family protein [Coriobacteriia bacterium]